MPRHKKVCHRCKGENILFDAWAEWDTDKQEMTICSDFDCCMCTDCDKECDAITIPIEQPEPEPKIKFVCDTCGGDNVLSDALAHWDKDKQDWVLSYTLDNSDCSDCERSARIKAVPLDQEPSQ